LYNFIGCLNSCSVCRDEDDLFENIVFEDVKTLANIQQTSRSIGADRMEDIVLITLAT